MHSHTHNPDHRSSPDHRPHTPRPRPHTRACLARTKTCRSPALRSPAVQTGDRVKLHAHGVTTFEITEQGDTHATITPSETHANAPGAYPFRIPLTGLVPANTEGQ